MGRFQPFSGVRYVSPDRSLDRLIAPPYDVVDPPTRTVLAARDPANAIHVELPTDDPADGRDRYQVARDLVTYWRSAGVVGADPVPAFYPYRMTTPEGRATTGVIGALVIPDDGDGGARSGDVLPHEQTLPKDRTDRLELLRATRMNLSPIWGLSLTPGLTSLFAPATAPLAEAVDDDGVRHELWMIDDPANIEEIGAAIAGSPTVLADGHHRYQVAGEYRRERRLANGQQAGGYDAIMALVVELSPDQLTVGPIHRTLAGLPAGFDLAGTFEKRFDLVRAGPADAATVTALGESNALALISPETAWLLEPRPGGDPDVDSALVGSVLELLPPHVATHRHHWSEAVSAVATGEADAAVLLRPPTVAQIAQWAAARRRMPPKTTYFSPKPRTGMVFRSLEES